MMKQIHNVVLGLALMMGLASPGWATEVETPTQILITNVDVWDGTSDTVAEGAHVLIEGNLIKQVGAAITAPSGATVIDGGGRTAHERRR